MKRSILVLCVLIAGAWPGLASGGPAPDAAPPSPPALPALAEGVEDETPTQVVPFLGTATLSATAQQRAAAGLPDGVGLAVQHVLEGSPADKAGLKVGDVLHKLGDQVLVNDPQFRVLLRTFHPGDTVQLSAFRDGKPLAVKVDLGKVRVPVGEVPAREMMRWMLMSPDAATADGAVELAAKYEDPQHTLLLAWNAQGKRLLVKDHQGKVLFDGPVNTDAERQSLPEAVRPKLKILETPPK